MSDILKSVWRTLVAIKDGVLIVLIAGLLLGLVRLFLPTPTAPLPHNKFALHLDLNGVIVEQYSPIAPLALANNTPMPQELRLRDILDALDRARTDSRVGAIVLDLDGLMGAGTATRQTLRAALQRVRQSGKPIYAFARYYTEAPYHIATVADEIWVDPMGGVLLQGMGGYHLYFKDALDRLNITVNVFKAGTYKSFVEPYTRTNMSDPAREALTAILREQWDGFASDVLRDRAKQQLNFTQLVSHLPATLDRYEGNLGQMALTTHAVDHLGNRQAFNAQLIKRVGQDKDADGPPTYKSVHFLDYLTATHEQQPDSPSAIGVVHVEGEIIDGDGPTGVAAAEAVVRQLHRALDEDSIKAVVLRINSPGGSALAAEQMREAVQALQKAGKPVVASMGDVAASGGYWVAATTDAIYALPGTITGSIGVFAVFPTFDRALTRWGVQSDGVGVGPLADLGNLTRPLTLDGQSVLQNLVGHTYHQFLDLVSTGRDMSYADADAAGQGRPWTGLAAKKRKLIDHFGGLEQAVADAARRAKLTDYKVVHVEEEENWQERLVRELVGSTSTTPTLHIADPLAKATLTARWQAQAALTQAQRWAQGSGVTAYCLACVTIAGPGRPPVSTDFGASLLKIITP